MLRFNRQATNQSLNYFFRQQYEIAHSMLKYTYYFFITNSVSILLKLCTRIEVKRFQYVRAIFYFHRLY